MKTVKLKNFTEIDRQNAIRALKDQIHHFTKDNLLSEILSLEKTIQVLREPEIAEAQKQFDKIINILNQAGVTVSSDNFYSYSGRSMYGKTCIGLTLDRSDYASAMKVLNKKKIHPSSDNMGMDMVIYFTNISPDDVLYTENECDNNEVA